MAFDSAFGSNEFRADSSSIEDHHHSPDHVMEIPSIEDTELTHLTPGQRIAFTAIVGILCMLSVFGNLGTLYANQKRKMRVFFRTCLISLALSDLITTLFMTMGYLTQFGAPYVQIWSLGDIMCRFIPFVTTGAILVSSMTLVGIALDRYFAVMKAVIGFWNPNKMFSIVFTICIWVLSFGIASPMYSAYFVIQIYILTSEVDRDGTKEVVEVDLVDICLSDKDSTAYYYIVVLAIIFVPTLVAFVWLNSIIANKLWIRRHSVSVTPAAASATPVPSATAAPFGSRKPDEKQMEMIPQRYDHPCHCQGGNKVCTFPTLTVPTSLVATATTATTTMTTSGVGGSSSNSAQHISSREARHLRMFIIILILMAVLIFFRLPAWVFLIMRMYGSYTRPVHWILHFSFGFLTLTSCVLNPLLYTFLAETIHYAMLVKEKLCGLKRYFNNIRTAADGTSRCDGCLLCRSSSMADKDNEKMTQNEIEKQHRDANQNGDDDGDDNDIRSNDGAKSTLTKSDDDSKVYTIIPVPRVATAEYCHNNDE